MAKKVIVVFIILASMGMFNLVFLGENIIKVFELVGIGLILMIILLQFVYSQGEGFNHSFKWEIIFIFTGVGLSMFTAYAGHGQGFTTTLIVQRFMYFYFLYFALHLIRISDSDLERLMIFLAVVHVVFYMIQFMVYPDKIFDVRISEDRGTLRIFLPGLSYVTLAFFYILNQLFKRFSLEKLLLLFFFLSVFVLMGTRQIIISIFLLTIVNVLLSKRVKSKSLILVLILIGAIPMVLLFQDIFLNLIAVSQKQSAVFEDDIRIQAATFFLTELFPNRISYITGNGEGSSASPYGQMMQMYKEVFGFFQSDVGIIGDYSKFGVFFLIGVSSILIRTLKGKLSEKYTYIRYFYISVLLTLFTGGSPFGAGDSIVAVCFTLYIIDIDKHNRKVEKDEENEEDEDEFKKEENAKIPLYTI
jgi:hypothetical protein